jgi:hypothetical protein
MAMSVGEDWMAFFVVSGALRYPGAFAVVHGMRLGSSYYCRSICDGFVALWRTRLENVYG